MSNLLERLVTRGVQAQAQIRPRLRGPYEAVSFGVLAAPGVTESNPIEPSAKPDDSPSVTGLTMAAASSPMEGRRARALQRAGSTEPLFTPRREDILSTPHIVRTTEQREVEAAPASPERLHFSRAAPPAVRDAAARSVDVDERGVRSTRNAGRDDAAMFRPVTANPPREKPALQPSPVFEPALPPLAPARVHDVARSLSPRAAAEQDSPVIHVRIGRIDVRAVVETPPTPPQPRRSGRPPLALEEYLRQRNRGER